MTELESYDEIIQAAYVAGVFDGSSEIHVGISKNNDYALGYRTSIVLRMNRQWPFALAEIDKFCQRKGIMSRLNESENGYTLRIRKPIHVKKFLEQIQPFVRDRREQIEHTVEEIVPRLEGGEHHNDEELFIEFVEQVEILRTLSERQGRSKYTTSYFKKEFEEEINENDG